MSEYETEPVWGLPERLPAGERILWQGVPSAKRLGYRAFHLRALALYFGVLLSWRAGTAVTDGLSLKATAFSMLGLALLAVAAVSLLATLAWLINRTTVYTITNRRLVMRFGVALPMTVNIPFAIVDSAALKAYPDGSGDIPLTLTRTQRIAYLHLWPHVRPWQFTRPQPMLRAIPDAEHVAALLCSALAGQLGAQTRAAPEESIRPVASAPKPAQLVASVN